jgi:integrase
MDYTQRGLERLMTPGNHWDPVTPGLVLRVRESGAKAWSFVYRMGGRASKKQWLKLGDFSVLPLNRAQKRARDLRVQVENGIDPKKAIEEAANEGLTIEGLAEKFRAEYIPGKSTSTQEGYGSALDKYILPDLGRLSVKAITRDQIGKWHKKIEKPIAANRALAVLSCMMTLAIEEWEIREGVNPCLNVSRNPENPRLRDITKAELAAIGQACKDLAGEHSLYALAAVRVVLLCWGRVSEVLGLRRDRDTFLEEGYAMIRVHKTRGSSGDKRLELPPPAVKILRGLPKEKDNPHYFPGRAKGESLTRNGLHKTWLAVCEKAGIKDLHLHDSRSLAASEAEAQGINPKTGAALLGHKDARTTAKHYAKVRKAREAAASVSAPIAEALGE